SLFAYSALDVFIYPVYVVRMDPLPHRFAARNALQRIKPKNACGIFGPIRNFRLGVDRGTEMGEPLCFRQIGFAAAYPIFSLPAFINIDRKAEPLDDPPLSVAQWLTAGNVPAIFG